MRDPFSPETAEKPSIPSALSAAMKQKGIDTTPLAFALCDMGIEADLRHIWLFFDETRLYVLISAKEETLYFSTFWAKGAAIPVPSDTVEEVYTYDLASLSAPILITEVVGGIFAVKIDGELRRICRYSASRSREVGAFCEELKKHVPCEEGDLPPMPAFGGRHRRKAENGCCPKCGRPYPEPERAVCPHCTEKRTIMARILRKFRPYLGKIILLMVVIFFAGLLNTVTPYLSGTVLYDNILGKDTAFAEKLGAAGDFSALLLMLVLMLGTLKLIRQITEVIHSRLTAKIVPNVVFSLKAEVFSALQRLSVGFFSRRQTGSLMQRVNGDANNVLTFFIDGLPNIFLNGFTLIFSIIVLFSMNWKLAILSVFTLPVMLFVNLRLMPYLWRANGRRSSVMRSLYAVLNDSFVGGRVVRAFGRERYEINRFDRANNRVRDAEVRVVRYHNLYNVTYTLARNIPVLLVWSFGGWLILRSGGDFTYGMLASFVGYLGMLQGPLEFFCHIFQWWSQSMNAAERVFEIIDAKPEIEESPDAVEVDLRGNIELQHVSFGYEPGRPVLKDISFSIKEGEMLGIVGQSGAGKTTLVNVISRLYDVDEGAVLMEGNDIRDIKMSSLRGAVAMVSQESFIFMGTIAENIAYARENATREEIVQAAIAAGAHRFICRLPDGYDTVIGTGGRRLSGGERQRLSIARAILADPKILVLDEATASVDTETERIIQEALEKLSAGRTTISIAHRLSTLRNADRLIVLKDGVVVESGTHAELTALRGEYFKLMQLQAKALAMRGVGE